MKKKKNIIIIGIVFLICLILVILFLYINKNIKNKDNNASKNFYTCSYNFDDGYKTSIYRYEIETDDYAVIKKVKDKIILDYTDDILYQEAKAYFSSEDSKTEFESNDKDKDITIYNYVDKISYQDKSYFGYIKKIDAKYKCDEIELTEVKYECIKSEETKDYTAKEVLNISSDKKMNIKIINKKTVLEYKDKTLYLESKKNYQSIYEKKYNDKDNSISYDYNLPLKDKDGNKVEINIKNYIDDMDKEYKCKLK